MVQRMVYAHRFKNTSKPIVPSPDVLSSIRRHGVLCIQ